MGVDIGVTRPQVKEAGNPLKLEDTWNPTIPRGHLEGVWPCAHLDLDFQAPGL